MACCYPGVIVTSRSTSSKSSLTQIILTLYPWRTSLPSLQKEVQHGPRTSPHHHVITLWGMSLGWSGGARRGGRGGDSEIIGNQTGRPDADCILFLTSRGYVTDLNWKNTVLCVCVCVSRIRTMLHRSWIPLAYMWQSQAISFSASARQAVLWKPLRLCVN